MNHGVGSASVVGHFEVVSHGLNNGLDLCSFLEKVGRPKVVKSATM